MITSLNNLISDAFMQTYTKFKNIDEFFDLSGYPYKNIEDHYKIITERPKQLDEFVIRETQFSSYINMMESAVAWSDPHHKGNQ